MTDTNKTEQETRSGLSDLTVKLAAQAHLDAKDAEARTEMALENAKANFSDWTPELRAYERAIVAASKAGKALRAALAELEVIRSEEGTCYYADKDGNPVDGPVGTYTVSYYKGCKSLENTEFQPCVDFPEGTHKLYLHPQRRPSDEEFKAWLIREMPSGTVISDPAWWAPRIIRALEKEQRK